MMAFNNKKVGTRYYGQRDTSLNSFDPILKEKPLPIIIGNLAAGTTEDQIKRVFSNYGKLNNIFMLFDQALIQMETQISSESAKRELDGKCFRGQIISVKYATADSTSSLTPPTNHIITTPSTRNYTRRKGSVAVSVKDLSPMVSNELLAESFCIFGVVDRGVVIVDNKGQSTTRAIVEFNNEQAARNAVQQIQEGSFLMTSSPRPISATLMEHEDSEVGLPEEKLPKSTQYYSDRKSLPRFAEPGTFEDLCANTWKVRYNLEREQREQFDKNIGETRAVFELEIENCRRAMQLKQENPVEREILEEKRQHEVEERRQNETARFDEHHNKMTESEIRQKVLGSQIEKQMSTSSVVTSSQQQQHYSGERTSIIPTRGAVAAAAASSSNAVAPYNPTQLTKQPPAAHPITAGSSNRADKKRFKCPQCPKRYSHSCNLTTHMRIHDKERQVKCEICSKVFATKHQYMSHMITHSSTRNRKKFQQRQLQISARQQQQQQQEVHKFLKCLECRGGGKYFRTPEALSVHMATTHKASISNEGNFSSRRSGTVVTYSCVYCDEKFTESETLRIHVTTHTENKYKFN